MSTSHAMFSVRVVGHVHGRPSSMAYVSTPGDADVRVQWRGPGSGRGRAGYRCDVHGALEFPDDCIHGDLAEVAFNHQREAEERTHRHVR